jgi:hypothetical protein
MPTFQGYTWTQAQLDSFWAHYVTMSKGTVQDVCHQEPVFRAMLQYCYFNHLYGFEQYDQSKHPAAGNINSYGLNKTVLS